MNQPLSTNRPQSQEPAARDEQPRMGDRSDPVSGDAFNSAGRLRGLLRRLGRGIPTAVVLAILAAIGIAGHQYGWKFPSFAALTGRATPAAVAWCEEHGVPEEICVSCNAELMPKGQLYGWCRLHGVHECVFEHPETAQLKAPISVTQDDLDRAARALQLRPRPQNDQGCKLHLRRIQLPSLAAVDKAGIDIGLVERGRIVEAIIVSGEVVYDQTRVARVSTRVPGTIWSVEKKVGDPVQRGDVLAIVDAVDVGRAKAELLQALAQLDLQQENYRRLSGLGQGVVEGRRVTESEAALSEARVGVLKAEQALLNLGLAPDLADLQQQSPAEQARRVRGLGLPDSTGADHDTAALSANLLTIRATIDGVVVARDVVRGEVVDRDKTLFTVADTSRMWLMLRIPIEEAKLANPGQPVSFLPDGLETEVEGRIAWISTAVDPHTRTVEARAELDNAGGALRDETFGTGRIILRDEANAIVVPRDAVHWEGCCFVAFVRDKHFLDDGSFKVFHTRMVRPGTTQGDYTEIIAGLLPDEVIVTRGSGMLRAELLKGNLGAG